MKPWNTPSIEVSAVRNLRVLKVGAVQDPRILQVQRVFQSNEPQNIREYSSISEYRTPKYSEYKQHWDWSYPKNSEYEQHSGVSNHEILRAHEVPDVKCIPNTRYFTPRCSEHPCSSYLHLPILMTYEHRLAFAQGDPIRQTLLSMTNIITAVLREETSINSTVFTFSVTTAAAVSIILVFVTK